MVFLDKKVFTNAKNKWILPYFIIVGKSVVFVLVVIYTSITTGVQYTVFYSIAFIVMLFYLRLKRIH